MKQVLGKQPKFPSFSTKQVIVCVSYKLITIRVSDPHFFADPDPCKNLHADPVPDPDPGGKGKIIYADPGRAKTCGSGSETLVLGI